MSSVCAELGGGIRFFDDEVQWRWVIPPSRLPADVHKMVLYEVDALPENAMYPHVRRLWVHSCGIQPGKAFPNLRELHYTNSSAEVLEIPDGVGWFYLQESKTRRIANWPSSPKVISIQDTSGIVSVPSLPKEIAHISFRNSPVAKGVDFTRVRDATSIDISGKWIGEYPSPDWTYSLHLIGDHGWSTWLKSNKLWALKFSFSVLELNSSQGMYDEKLSFEFQDGKKLTFKNGLPVWWGRKGWGSIVALDLPQKKLWAGNCWEATDNGRNLNRPLTE